MYELIAKARRLELAILTKFKTQSCSIEKGYSCNDKAGIGFESCYNKWESWEDRSLLPSFVRENSSWSAMRLSGNYAPPPSAVLSVSPANQSGERGSEQIKTASYVLGYTLISIVSLRFVLASSILQNRFCQSSQTFQGLVAYSRPFPHKYVLVYMYWMLSSFSEAGRA